MVVNPNEAPESYLNKGQTYHLRVVDTTPPRFTETTKYRTFIRSLSRNEDSEVVWLRLARQTSVPQMTEGQEMITKVKTLPASHSGGNGPSADAQLGIWLDY
ncbi:uncharacterized protein N7473_000014 [Penicillium subrubescens]|uniref:uncharacterized protein n=1 Tax=Penicillium subrubescens TaxID=1316194 RepID=UPI0025458675|nr:uncharacterized protein N7473_000014 [Penicillium subrubescens]KAJ5910711.1 hypothetical protein N7473_000014 [Penicillium subrubescens]